MARGWGKNEEDLGAEKEQARADRDRAGGAPPREEVERAARRRTIEMSLTRIREQLAKVTHPERRTALEEARRELEARLKDV